MVYDVEGEDDLLQLIHLLSLWVVDNDITVPVNFINTRAGIFIGLVFLFLHSFSCSFFLFTIALSVMSHCLTGSYAPYFGGAYEPAPAQFEDFAFVLFNELVDLIDLLINEIVGTLFAFL